ncbi:MAG: isoprenylcysteine carboxylmethyltransferase family protein [Rhodospirillaceae bacterium]
MSTPGPNPAPRLIRMPPPLWALAALLVALAIHLAHDWAPALRVFPLGLVLIVVGVALAAWARLIFARRGAEILPASRINSKLVEEGPFRVSRNPMYLGGLAAALGIALAVGTLPFFLVPAFLFWILARHFIPFEEAKMERQFEGAYRAYKARVRRWI